MNPSSSALVCSASLATILLWVPSAAAQQPQCVGYFEMQNRNRHVIGEVNQECPPSWHSATWGNWGVSSNTGDLEDTAQFFGWKPQSGTWQHHWNSCTGDHNRDEDATYYNHDHNSNGFGDDQFSEPQNPYSGGQINLTVECGRDYNADGVCDTGGCFTFPYWSSMSGVFLSLYELDWPDGDDFITTLYAPSGCCGVTPSCNAQGCGGADSAWWETNYSTDVAATAEVRMHFLAAVYDSTPTCDWLKGWNSEYDCY